MIHKEGIASILGGFVFSLILIVAARYFFAGNAVVFTIACLLSLALMVMLIQFFRNPGRTIVLNDNNIIAPADGKIVVIEETTEQEYLKTICIQVSIFMSPLNVHVNRNPVSGHIEYMKYHPGKFLVAWHPKSSTDNERTTVVYKLPGGKLIALRQIAGAMARRIVYYLKPGMNALQGEQMGFIKFGSRVDLFLPLGTKILVKQGENVIGGHTVIAHLAEE